MAEQQEYGLQPQARPTDQYARPEVRMPEGYAQSKQLQQVSEALRGFYSDVGEIADRRYAAWRQATDRQADQYTLTHAADRLDALAMAVAYWSKALSVETDKVVQSNRDKLMKQELERYMPHAMGHKPKGRMYATTMHNR